MEEKISTYINPLTDFGFKFIFGREADKEFILSFLNALIGGKTPITSVTFIDKEKKGESKDDRALIYDLHCKLADGRKIIVEMQNRYQTHFDDRALYYLAGDIIAQGEKGEGWDYSLTPVYGVFLMNFEWRNVDEQLLREDICLFNMQTKKVFSDKLSMTFLKIPMMDKEAEDCKTTLEKWLYLLKHMETMEAIPHTFAQDPVFRRLGKVARYAALNEKDKEAYKASLKAYRDGYAIAETERKLGREEGEKEAMMRVAKKMKAKGNPIEEIMSLTDLSKSEIQQL